jgi:hypothetical protein
MNYRVVGALFLASFLALGLGAGPASGEFQVNTYVQRSKVPAVTLGADGGFVVAWAAYSPGSNYKGIDARRFDASGAPRGAEWHVSTHTADTQWGAALASDAADNFVVVWTSQGQDGSGGGVFGQRYDASGVPRGAAFQANEVTGGDQGSTRASDVAGGFIVVWEAVAPTRR